MKHCTHSSTRSSQAVLTTATLFSTVSPMVSVIRRLQSVPHADTRLITGIRRYEHITPTLRDTLHWLTISQCITFKTALMMSDCSRSRCPKYFGDVCTPVNTVAARSRLRSEDHRDLIAPHVRSTQFSSRNFHVCGPTIWNKLLQDLQSTDTREQFKRSLKRWLFECAYGRRRIG